ncbi:hypothetical protein Y956_08036, partial [Nipponia nippon]
IDRGKKAAVRQLVQRELDAGHIEPSTSPWNTPVFVIKKKLGAWRLLRDLRAVNACIQDMGPLQAGLPSPAMIPPDYPIVVIDIRDCFFSVLLHEEDRVRFAFTVPEPNNQHPCARYQWKVLPQGMKNSPVLCQIAVAAAICPIRENFPTVIIFHYMDDVLLASNQEELLEKARVQLIVSLERHGLHIEPRKTQVGRAVKYLGTQLRPRSVTAQSFEIRTTVTTLHEAQKLIGQLLWLRNFIPISEAEMTTLYQLLKGGDSPL